MLAVILSVTEILADVIPLNLIASLALVTVLVPLMIIVVLSVVTEKLVKTNTLEKSLA